MNDGQNLSINIKYLCPCQAYAESRHPRRSGFRNSLLVTSCYRPATPGFHPRPLLPKYKGHDEN